MIRHKRIRYRVASGEVTTRCYLYEVNEEPKGLCPDHNGGKPKRTRKGAK